MRQFLESLRVAFPDWRVEVLDCIADGDRVGVRWQGRATHEGPFHGLSPTDKQVAIATEWEQMDTIGLLTQLGVRIG
jgi:predicted ester cyclase